MDDYRRLQALHHSLPAFTPAISISLLPFVAAFCLLPTFALAFYSSTLPTSKLNVKEPATALVASILGGFGVVALFCSVGVYV
ncbi:hypothetical protein CPB83DRAFT_857777 [Crepidotus variabilis]|uniref:Dolichyl-diphosphooligosaccharide-protein glycosyltransferase subunit OST5 n=1 Tax=Crepidotus variabilis TaxID=179855 RepID=A0A9P6EBL2_9AGAR|nr:hypothetical protein CPB83DRAFT_857777 [Crepidotus variabilis]